MYKGRESQLINHSLFADLISTDNLNNPQRTIPPQKSLKKQPSQTWIPFTPWKFNGSPLKIYHPKRKVVFQPSFFRGYVKLREGTSQILHPTFPQKIPCSNKSGVSTFQVGSSLMLVVQSPNKNRSKQRGYKRPE